MKLFIDRFVLFVGIFLLFSYKAKSDERRWSVASCGRYRIYGVVRKHPAKGLCLVVNEKSKSENIFTLKSGELSKIALFIDKSISMDASILKIDGTKGEVSSIDSVSTIIPDPLHPKMTNGFLLEKHMECEHE